MKSLIYFLAAVFGALLVMNTLGCVSTGHYKASVSAFGNEFSVEHEVYPDETGKRVYKTGFDPDWTPGILDWLFGKEKPTEEVIE